MRKSELASGFNRWLRGGFHTTRLQASEILRYIGPGLLVAVGFIDPGNWASNLAAGAGFGYSLLWMVTLATIMLIILQHNAAHLGIATGLCLSEATTQFLPALPGRLVLTSGLLATVATVLAEVMGGAIALNMLFGLPIRLGGIIVTVAALVLLFGNSYRRLERWIMAFIGLIGLSFLVELSMVQIDWPVALVSWVKPEIPAGALPILMSVLGAVVMPHNLFLHSEIIQSRQWNLEDDRVIRKQLRFEFVDTLTSMGLGWAINSAMILVAASTFFANGVAVDELQTAQQMLRPLLGDAAALIFAFALLVAGLASSITAGMAGGSIFAGAFNEQYNIADKHSGIGVLLVFVLALAVVFVVTDPFMSLVYSQMLLSVQLPITIFLQIYLTSSKRVMGRFANGRLDKALLLACGVVVSALNIILLHSFLSG